MFVWFFLIWAMGTSSEISVRLVHCGAWVSIYFFKQPGLIITTLDQWFSHSGRKKGRWAMGALKELSSISQVHKVQMYSFKTECLRMWLGLRHQDEFLSYFLSQPPFKEAPLVPIENLPGMMCCPEEYNFWWSKQNIGNTWPRLSLL